jgi:hypothetical protein
MLWIVQEDIYARNQQYNLFDALTRLDIPFIKVQVNNNKIEPDIPAGNESQIITNGSIMLSNIGKAKGWEPGSLFNDNFSYKVWAEHYKELLINKNAVVSSLKNAKVHADKIFARPVLDNKSFNGRVFTKEEFLKFQADSVNLNPSSPKPDIEILVSAPKAIGQEHRHYIVDGEVITSSRYKLAGKANFKEGADDAVIDVVKKAIKLFQPARAFVLDTYIAGDEIGIVEIGCICHAGLYDADLIKLVSALDSMPIEPKFDTKEHRSNKPKR